MPHVMVHYKTLSSFVSHLASCANIHLLMHLKQEAPQTVLEPVSPSYLLPHQLMHQIKSLTYFQFICLGVMFLIFKNYGWIKFHFPHLYDDCYKPYVT